MQLGVSFETDFSLQKNNGHFAQNLLNLTPIKFNEMTSETKIRNQLIQRIQRIPLDKLNELTEFVARIEKTASSKEKTLSYAGAWENIDALTFDNLTRNLIENRQSNKRRYE